MGSLALSGTMLATPTLATTDSGAYGHHQLNCLGMLFGDPKVHEAQCGPFTAPPFWFPTGGSGPACARVTELLPSQRAYPQGLGDGYVVATAPTACSCAMLTEAPWQPLELTTGLKSKKRTLIAFPAPDPCQ